MNEKNPGDDVQRGPEQQLTAIMKQSVSTCVKRMTWFCKEWAEASIRHKI